MGTLSEPVALLNFLASLLLGGLALFITFRGDAPTRARIRLRRTFLLLTLALLLWQWTLFWEVRTPDPVLRRGLGRVNFAAIAFATYLAHRFVEQVAVRPPNRFQSNSLLLETGVLMGLTLFTPLISSNERVEAGRATTTFGLLFPVYLLHVLGYLAGALAVTFEARRRTKDRQVRGQLTLIGGGMLATGGVAFITNALLPYGLGDFRYCAFGTLSVSFFAVAVAYAAFLRRLFGLRALLREAVVYGVLLTFVLGAYSSVLILATQYVTDGKLIQFAVLMIAFSFDPLRRFLEKEIDRLLFGERKDSGAMRKR